MFGENQRKPGFFRTLCARAALVCRPCGGHAALVHRLWGGAHVVRTSRACPAKNGGLLGARSALVVRWRLPSAYQAQVLRLPSLPSAHQAQIVCLPGARSALGCKWRLSSACRALVTRPTSTCSGACQARANLASAHPARVAKHARQAQTTCLPNAQPALARICAMFP